MLTVMTPELKRKRRKTIVRKKTPKPIPDYLVYEMVNHMPIYYRGYQEVMAGQKQPEEIMGSSFIQSMLISRLVVFLSASLAGIYEVLTNEVGLQFSKGNWRTADIAIYAKAQLHNIPLHNNYLNIPPKVVIEIDAKADFEPFVSAMDYYYVKTDALLDFGVEKVIWIFTDVRKVMIAESNKDWITRRWDQEISIIDNLNVTLSELLTEEQGK